MKAERRLIERPFFSVCIPQYNRTSFLLEALRSLAAQSFRDFEVCISDDCSTDHRENEIIDFLKTSGLSYVVQRRESNGRYDKNLRSAIALSRGVYCFLLGNDDALAHSMTLETLHDQMRRFVPPGAVITNYAEDATGRVFRRVRTSGLLGSGPDAAANHFRNFSFVSGVVLNAEKAREFSTEVWDGTEMYQMFLGAKIVASGHTLMAVDAVVIRQALQLPGEAVDSYATRQRVERAPLVERRIPLNDMGRLVVAAIEPFVDRHDRQRFIRKILSQILIFTYPFWIIEYRRVQSWRFAYGIALGMRTKNIAAGLGMSVLTRCFLSTLHAGVTFAALVMPIRFFDAFRPMLYALAKSFSKGRDT